MTSQDGGQAVREAASVQLWLARTSLGEPPAATERRVVLLAGFLQAAERTADELVAFCFLRKRDSGDRFVSAKRRTAVNDDIEKYATQQGWTGKDAVANGNVIRSFLIHNGIPIGSRTWTGG